MNLNDIHRGVQTAKPRKRLGRGIGSGQGKTAGRGHKGQWSHNGVSFSPVFQGGTQPLVRRIPKRGFTNSWAKTVVVVNLDDLEKNFKAGDHVTPESLGAAHLVGGIFDQVKILGDGELKKKLKISAHKFSKTASEKIAAAGGEAIVLPGPKPVVKVKRSEKKTK
ncbi:MAG TPA: 50S ribosomal protein L15 [Lacipirellulaceae bacterium]|jgi:large subunit ribosomal protein L15|nr:50S ribosomal protein L15 [Lacipirellulaceae bacterium]